MICYFVNLGFGIKIAARGALFKLGDQGGLERHTHTHCAIISHHSQNVGVISVNSARRSAPGQFVFGPGIKIGIGEVLEIVAISSRGKTLINAALGAQSGWGHIARALAIIQVAVDLVVNGLYVDGLHNFLSYLRWYNFTGKDGLG